MLAEQPQDKLKLTYSMFKDLSYELQLRDIADTDYRALRLSVLYASGGLYIYNGGHISPAGIIAGQKYNLRGYDVGASAYEIVASVLNHATQPSFEIKTLSGSLDLMKALTDWSIPAVTKTVTNHLSYDEGTNRLYCYDIIEGGHSYWNRDGII